MNGVCSQIMNKLIRKKLYPGEDEYFKKNPHVAGMAAEDNKIILNPYSGLNNQQKQAVVANEGARIFMRTTGFKPDFAVTPQQKKLFLNYGNDQDVKETIVGRILSNDSSAGDVTKEQRNFVNQLKAKMKMNTFNSQQKKGPGE